MKGKGKDKTKKSSDSKKTEKKHKDDSRKEKLQKASGESKGGKKKKNKKQQDKEKKLLRESMPKEVFQEAAAMDGKADRQQNEHAAESKSTGGGMQAAGERGRKKRRDTGSGENGSQSMAQASVFRALGDESRLQILILLRKQEMCAADLLKQLPIVQSTLSHHMKILCESGLVICRKQGRWSRYVLNRQRFEDASDCLREWTEASDTPQ